AMTAGRDVYRLAFSPDGKVLAALDSDHVVQLWGAQAGNERYGGGEGAAKPLCLAFSPEGSMMALGCEDGTVRLCGTATGKERLGGLRGGLAAGPFGGRERASAELAALGEPAEPALRQLLRGKPPPGARRRAAALLDKLDGPLDAPETLRALRAVEALEMAGT